MAPKSSSGHRDAQHDDQQLNDDHRIIGVPASNRSSTLTSAPTSRDPFHLREPVNRSGTMPSPDQVQSLYRRIVADGFPIVEHGDPTVVVDGRIVSGAHRHLSLTCAAGYHRSDTTARMTQQMMQTVASQPRPPPHRGTSSALHVHGRDDRGVGGTSSASSSTGNEMIEPIIEPIIDPETVDRFSSASSYTDDQEENDHEPLPNPQ